METVSLQQRQRQRQQQQCRQTAATMPRDMFTKLLVAQIQNQDPLSPTDPSQFVNS
jgi:flagellar hook assembly protein FlgD